MADDFGLGLNKETFLSGLDAVSWAMIIISIIIVLGFIVWFIWFRAQFKYSITIREKTKKGTDKIYFDKYRKINKLGLSQRIQLWSDKSYHLPAPDGAIDILGKNGKDYVEAYKTDGNELKYVCCDLDGGFNSLTADDKEFYANVFENAQKFKTKGIMEWISENSGAIMVLIAIVLVVAFWNDIAQSTMKVSASNAEITKSNAKIIDTLESLLRDRAYLGNYNISSPKNSGTPLVPVTLPD